MAVDRNEKYRQMVLRGKYQRLYTYLRGRQVDEWRTSFGEIEAVIGFDLPASARLHRPWWGNQKRGNGHSHALAWSIAGWETAEVDMDAETLLFRRTRREARVQASAPRGLACSPHRVVAGRPEPQARGPLRGAHLARAVFIDTNVLVIVPHSRRTGPPTPPGQAWNVLFETPNR